MSEFKPRRCRECGEGTIRPLAKEVVIPTCDKCSNEWIDPETAEALDEALSDQERAELRALRSEAVMDEYPAACRALDRLLHHDREHGLDEMAQATQDAGGYPELSPSRRAEIDELTKDLAPGIYDMKMRNGTTFRAEVGMVPGLGLWWIPVREPSFRDTPSDDWTEVDSVVLVAKTVDPVQVVPDARRRKLVELTEIAEEAGAYDRMPAEAATFDPAVRAAEKQASRDADAQALASGAKTVEQLRAENASFAFPRARIRFPKKEK